MSRIPIPENIKRELRQEVNFGCAICGNPLFEYHHIIPIEEKQHNDPNHMIVLCANHHRLADNGTIKRNILYEIKKKPFNSDKTTDKFIFQSRFPGIVLGTVAVLFLKNIINFDGKVVLAMDIRYSGFLQLDAEIFDIDGNVIASIKNNEWIVYTTDIWDMKYHGKHLKIWNEQKKVGFEIEYSPANDLVFINGRFCYNSRSIQVSKGYGIIYDQANSRLDNFVVVGPGQKFTLKGATIFNIDFLVDTLLYVPIEKKTSTAKPVFSFDLTHYVCVVDNKTRKIHLPSCKQVTSQVFPDGIGAITNKPRPSNIIDYDSISKAEKAGFIRCKICM